MSLWVHTALLLVYWVQSEISFLNFKDEFPLQKLGWIEGIILQRSYYTIFLSRSYPRLLSEIHTVRYSLHSAVVYCYYRNNTFAEST